MAKKRRPVSPTIAERLAAIEASMERDHEDRVVANEDRKQLLGEIRELHSSVNGIQQTISSAQSVLNTISGLQSGTRLEKLESRLVHYEGIEADFLFWKRFLGSGSTLLWRFIGLVVSSGAVVLLVRWLLEK